MSRRAWSATASLTVGSALVAGAPLLLRRMQGDLLGEARLRTSTAAWMWATYTAHAALTAAALTTGPSRPPLPEAARVAAVSLSAAGAALDVAGVRHFAGPAQLTGTTAGSLITGGVYRYSRHPQYTGIIATLTGLAALRRAPAALAQAGALATTYRSWAPIEEDHLARRFGQAYRDYRDTTPRWLGLPSRRRIPGRRVRTTARGAVPALV